MANPTWPAGVNAKVLLGETEKLRPNVVRSTMSTGVPKIRRRSTLPLEEIDFQQRMTETEWLAFKNWFRTTLKDGSLAFDHPQPLGGQTVKYQFRAPPAPTLTNSEAVLVQISLLIVP